MKDISYYITKREGFINIDSSTGITVGSDSKCIIKNIDTDTIIEFKSLNINVYNLTPEQLFKIIQDFQNQTALKTVKLFPGESYEMNTTKDIYAIQSFTSRPETTEEKEAYKKGGGGGGGGTPSPSPGDTIYKWFTDNAMIIVGIIIFVAVLIMIFKYLQHRGII